ncbi:MAG: Smr/MutS family protein, partial [Thermoflexales bacterium]|nr:Smr/MutS family protein [Thermoflexales bacterium]
IEDERATILKKARADVQHQIDALRAEVDGLRKKLSVLQQPEVVALREEVDQLEKQAESIVPSPTPIEKPALGPRHAIRVGDHVFVERIGSIAEVSGFDRGQVEVAIGSLRMRVKPDEVEWRSSPQLAKAVVSTPTVQTTTQARMEVDLRGLRVEEGIMELDRQLDAAALNGMPFVRIIHGKGTGAMKKAVREALQNNPHVKRFEGGKDGEGGDGVTVAFMVSEL